MVDERRIIFDLVLRAHPGRILCVGRDPEVGGQPARTIAACPTLAGATNRPKTRAPESRGKRLAVALSAVVSDRQPKSGRHALSAAMSPTLAIGGRK